MTRLAHILPLLLALCAGCISRKPTIPHLTLTTYDEGGCPEPHEAYFSRTGYRASPGGMLEIVMEGEAPCSYDPTQTIRQVLYVKTMWYPQPGRTYVEATQRDATMMYAILTPPTGIRCDGSAMLTYKWNNKGKKIDAYIESGTLTPKFRMGDAVEPFGPARFVGDARVYENPGQVVKTYQFLKTQFSEPASPRAAMDLSSSLLLADSAGFPLGWSVHQQVPQQ